MSRIAAAFTSACAAVCVIGAAGLVQAGSKPPPGPTPAEIVTARQTGMAMSGGLKGFMQMSVEAGAEAKKLAYPAGGLARWAKVTPTLFPAGTGLDRLPGKTTARPEIWSDRAGFARSADDFVATTETLAALARANDTEGFKAQLVKVNAACEACHAAYRAGPSKMSPAPASPDRKNP